jgi:DNA-binding GntR family transcriptional regulator
MSIAMRVIAIATMRFVGRKARRLGRHHRAFLSHAVVARATGGCVCNPGSRVCTQFWYTDGELIESQHEHLKILAALRDRDPAAAEDLMRRHITRGLTTLRREIAASGSTERLASRDSQV